MTYSTAVRVSEVALVLGIAFLVIGMFTMFTGFFKGNDKVMNAGLIMMGVGMTSGPVISLMGFMFSHKVT